MEYVKTAISIQKSLFDKADQLARQMNVPRSRLFVLALEEYIQHQQSRELLAQINAAYADEPDPVEQTYLKNTRKLHRKIAEGEW
jgi:metal-responsive CopG/Arc/MetJ family transcriptional regulator